MVGIWKCVVLKMFKKQVSNFTVVICCPHAVFTHFKTKIYSKFFPTLATTTKKYVK